MACLILRTNVFLEMPPPYLNLDPDFAPMMDQRNICLHA